MSSVKLSTYPLKINGTDIPFPDNPIQEKFETLETVNESEAGTDIVQIRRLGKLNLSCSYQLMGSWAKFFENIYLTQTPATVKIWDSYAEAYSEKTMRMRDFSKTLVKGSEKIETSGMWQISFSLIEM